LSRVTGNGWVYEHGIAAYALGEAYIFTKEASVGEVVKKAVAMIVDGQGKDGGLDV
jgi:rhamnogalacturonyl hydrolase YesR